MATTEDQDDKTEAPPSPPPAALKQEEEAEAEEEKDSKEIETEDEKTPSKRSRTERTREEVKVEKDEVVNEELAVVKEEKSKESETEIETPRGRPHRERKAVERYSIASPPSRGSGSSKSLSIAKGSGTPLKEIPNVAFKLSKKKPDDNLQLLHTILFGKKAKVHTLKRDIGQFSGFVWVDNEEKHQAKIKEKLDKCVKEKLLDFCDVLNIPINKALVRKEDLSVKLLEFLKSPHATTEELLADKEQKIKKQKGKGTPARSRSSKGSSGEKSEKNQVGEKQKKSTKSKKENEAAVGDNDLDRQSHSSEEDEEAEKKEESDQEETKSDEEEDGIEEKKTSSKSTSKGSSGEKSGKKITNINKNIPEESFKSPAKSVEKATGTKRSKSVAEASASSSKTKGSSGKRQKVNEESLKGKPVQAKEKPAKKQASKSASKSASGKGKAGKATKVTKAEPTNDELRDEATKILNEVDFNTATLSDILRLLGAHFGLDLMHRKGEVKAIITEVIESMSNDDDDDDGDDDDEEDGDKEDSGKE